MPFELALVVLDPMPCGVVMAHCFDTPVTHACRSTSICVVTAHSSGSLLTWFAVKSARELAETASGLMGVALEEDTESELELRLWLWRTPRAGAGAQTMPEATDV